MRHLLQEERVALRLREQYIRGLTRKVDAEGLADESDRRFPRQFEEVDRAGRLRGQVQVRRTFDPFADQQQDARGRALSSDVLEQIERAAVGPVRVLEVDRTRPIVSRATDQGRHEIEHALAAAVRVERPSKIGFRE